MRSLHPANRFARIALMCVALSACTSDVAREHADVGATAAALPAADCSKVEADAGTCGGLPQSFVCEPGATGPGVYDGELSAHGRQALAQLTDACGVCCVTGSVTLYDTDLTDLSVLSSLQMIGGSLYIVDNDALANVAGLAALERVGGSISIERNNALKNLLDLTALRAIGPVVLPPYNTLRIAHNASLPGCWSWLIAGQVATECIREDYGYSSSTCADNTGAGSCGELPAGFVCEAGATGPGVYDFYVAAWGPGAAEKLDDLGGVTCITGGLTIHQTDLMDLSMFASLELLGNGLNIVENESLQSVDGLAALERIGGSIRIEDNDALQNLAGLTSLREMGPTRVPGGNMLQITGNASLPGCWGSVIAAQVGTQCTRDGDNFTVCADNDGTGSCALGSPSAADVIEH
jgi:hypothetical protein